MRVRVHVGLSECEKGFQQRILNYYNTIIIFTTFCLVLFFLLFQIKCAAPSNNYAVHVVLYFHLYYYSYLIV